MYQLKEYYQHKPSIAVVRPRQRSGRQQFGKNTPLRALSDHITTGRAAGRWPNGE